jgi:hypothetical protein
MLYDESEGSRCGAVTYLAVMPRLPNWVPRSPGCGCLVLLLVAIAALLVYGDAR